MSRDGEIREKSGNAQTVDLIFFARTHVLHPPGLFQSVFAPKIAYDEMP